MNETPTPRTDAEIDDARNVALEFECKTPPPKRGDNVYVVSADFARQLERELNNSIKIQDGMAMTILSLQAERDQLRKVCDEFAIPYVLERKTK
jgi:hypothetical protein